MKYLILPLLGFLAFQSNAQDNIADLRSNYNVGDVATITGIITNGAELGAIRYIQDESGGIALYPGTNWGSQDFEPQPGDNITITGEITEFANLLEIGPSISSLVLNSAGNVLPEPIILTPAEISEQYEGMLVAINQAIFADGGTEFTVSTYNYIAQDEQGIIYIPNGSPIIGELVPFGAADFSGILSQYSFADPNAGYQILPKSYDDFLLESNINLTSQLEQYDLTTSSFDLAWSTDIASTTQMNYGLTPEMGTIATVGGEDVIHTVSLEGLESGTPYFCQAFSVLGEDTARSAIGVYSTVSESSGVMQVYFNRSVDITFATIEEAHSLFDDTDDTIIAYINRAQTTLDIAVYNNNSTAIVEAINNALDRDVMVRYIAEGGTANTALNGLDPSISVLDRQDAIASGMHNKFLIVDRNNVDSAIVLTGSTNWTSNNLFSDPNNMVIIQDQALARAYTLEFNEMWGGEESTPDVAASRFGEFKINNTPKKFIIGGIDIELYFSPSDNATGGIEEAIGTTDYSLDFALLLITNNILTDAIIAETSILTNPRGIIEDININGSDVDELIDGGVEIISHQGIPGQLHHKYGIVDHIEPLSDPTVITGSHNWSGSAESTNDENTLIIHDARVANLFFQEFMARYEEATLSVRELDALSLKLYPNPAQSEVRLDFELKGGSELTVRLFDMNGRLVKETAQWQIGGQNSLVLELDGLENGIYLIALESELGSSFKKLVVNH